MPLARIGSAVGGAAMVRDFGAKLRITAAALGCASQKDLCARFREANPGTIFELDRSYKWMQGRALPRSVGLYEDWAALLGTEQPDRACCSRARSTSSSIWSAIATRSAGTPLPLGRASRRHAAAEARPTAVTKRGSSGRGIATWSAPTPGIAFLVVLSPGQDHSRRVGHRGHRRGRAGAAGHHDLQRADIVGPRPAERAGEGQPRRSFRPDRCRRRVPGVDVPVPSRGAGERAGRRGVRRQLVRCRSPARREPDGADSHTGRNGGGARGVEPVCRRDAAAFGRPRGARHSRRGVSRAGRAAGRVPAGRSTRAAASRRTAASIPSWRWRSTGCSSGALRAPACSRSRGGRGAPRATRCGSYRARPPGRPAGAPTSGRSGRRGRAAGDGGPARPRGRPRAPGSGPHRPRVGGCRGPHAVP